VTARSARRVPLIGGMAAWHVPLVTVTLSLGGLGLGLLELAVSACVLGFVAQSLLRGLVVEIAPRGLTRGFALNGRFLGGPMVMTWEAIVDVHSDWRCPGDDTALRTSVRDRQGRTIYFTTAMGLRAYWWCLGAVAAGAPAAERSGLTEALLSQPPPSRRNVRTGAATAAALALVIVAVAGVHCLWAQGRSSLARQLEQIDTAPGKAPDSADPGPWRGALNAGSGRP
jgi:hypothetical protein